VDAMDRWGVKPDSADFNTSNETGLYVPEFQRMRTEVIRSRCLCRSDSVGCR